uniref:Uncharacterized protein n=1 Tax=Anguilla anguilla TaxID=7936 RepID=A0A0E9TPK1_ANGAN
MSHALFKSSRCIYIQCIYLCTWSQSGIAWSRVRLPLLFNLCLVYFSVQLGKQQEIDNLCHIMLCASVSL